MKGGKDCWTHLTDCYATNDLLMDNISRHMSYRLLKIVAYRSEWTLLKTSFCSPCITFWDSDLDESHFIIYRITYFLYKLQKKSCSCQYEDWMYRKTQFSFKLQERYRDSFLSYKRDAFVKLNWFCLTNFSRNEFQPIKNRTVFSINLKKICI